MKLIACDVLVGLPRKPLPRINPTIDDLVSEMQRLDVAAALVRHRQCVENAPDWGNKVVARETAGHPGLLPVWALTPDGAEGDGSIERTVSRALGSGVRVGWISPRSHFFSVRPWCSAPLYHACSAVRLPLLLDYAQVTVDEIDEVMSAFPALRLILMNVPRYGRSRDLYRLFELHPALHLCINSSYSVHEGIVELIRNFGVGRLLWGSGYPEREGGASVTLLSYAAIGEADRAAIGHGNVERLLREVLT